MPNNFANAQNLVAIREIRDGVLVLTSGELRQVLIVGGINFSLKSDAEQNLITGAYQNFLNSLNFSLQILIHSRKINIDRYLSTLDERRDQEKSGLLQDQIAEYQSFIREFVHDNAIMRKVFLVVVPFTPVSLPSRESVLGFLPFLKKNAAPDPKVKEAEDTSFRESAAQLSQRVSQVTDGLRAIGLEVEPLNDEQLVELFYNFYNPESVEKEKAASS